MNLFVDRSTNGFAALSDSVMSVLNTHQARCASPRELPVEPPIIRARALHQAPKAARMIHVLGVRQFVDEQITHHLGSRNTSEQLRLTVPRVEQLPHRVRWQRIATRSRNSSARRRSSSKRGANRSAAARLSHSWSLSRASAQSCARSNRRSPCKSTRCGAAPRACCHSTGSRSPVYAKSMAGHRRGRLCEALHGRNFAIDPGGESLHEVAHRVRVDADGHHDLDPAAHVHPGGQRRARCATRRKWVARTRVSNSDNCVPCGFIARNDTS